MEAKVPPLMGGKRVPGDGNDVPRREGGRFPWRAGVAAVAACFLLVFRWPAPHPHDAPRFAYSNDDLTRLLKLRSHSDVFPPRPTGAGVPQPDDRGAAGGLYPERRRVAIVGAGAFGSSLAYFLHQLIPPTDLSITVFDKLPRAGGRVRALGMYDPCRAKPVAFELGAAIFAQGNQFVANLTRKFGLDLKNESDFDPDPPGTRLVGLWDGESFLYQFSGGFWSGPAAFLRWGLSIVNGRNMAAEAEREWDQVYGLLADGETSGSPGAMLSKLGGLDTLVAGMSAREYLEGRGLGERYLDEFVEPAVLVNYFRPLSAINPLAALVSMTAEYSAAYQVRDGNFQVFEEALLASGAGWVKQEEIVAIKREPGRGKAKYTLVGADGKDWIGFDDVVLAGPLHTLNVSLPDDIPPPFYPRPYVEIHVTIVVGILSPEYFGLPPLASPPLNILTPQNTASPVPFRSISVLHRFPCLNHGANITVTKIFSALPMQTADLLAIYEKVYDLARYAWPAAYPDLAPYSSPEEMPGFGPYGDGVYFGGAGEAPFSCMEGQVVAARNVAGLIAEQVARAKKEAAGTRG
ncbi:Prenylcysteine lyase-domain-containing protein [Hyaloraphidium curvatum]|nr:Prenylcysteine lyase-domain-containing protein [Hyaloraphidium curvatum]